MSARNSKLCSSQGLFFGNTVVLSLETSDSRLWPQYLQEQRVAFKIVNLYICIDI